MNENSQDRRWIYYLVGIICIVVVVVLLILFLLQGDTKLSGEGSSSTVQSVTCEAEDLWYPFFRFDNSGKKTMKINILFDDKDKLDTVNLVYRLDYDTDEMADRSVAENHASMAKHFESDSIGVDAFEARYANVGKTMQMSLHAKANEINGVSAKYFLINGSNGLSKDILTNNYNEQGLNCVILNKQ